METTIDELMRQVSEQIQMPTDEVIYKAEIQNQTKIYILLICLGIAMFIVSMLINVNY